VGTSVLLILPPASLLSSFKQTKETVSIAVAVLGVWLTGKQLGQNETWVLLSLVGAYLAATPLSVARVVSRVKDNGFIDLNHQALVTLFYVTLVAVVIMPLGVYPQIATSVVADPTYKKNRVWIWLFSAVGGLLVSTAVIAQLSLVRLDKSIMFVQCFVQVMTVAGLWLGEYIFFDSEDSVTIGALATLSMIMIVYAALSQILISKEQFD